MVVPNEPVTSMAYGVDKTRVRSSSLKNVNVRLSESIVMAEVAVPGDTRKV